MGALNFPIPLTHPIYPSAVRGELVEPLVVNADVADCERALRQAQGERYSLDSVSNIELAYPRALSSINARKTPSGFTLVEILIVVVIIGIGLSIAVSNLFVSEEERVRQESERLLALIEKTRDEAAFSGYPIVMRLTDKGIEFLVRDASSISPKWQDATSASLAPRQWREGVAASLIVKNQDRTDTKSNQTVTFLPAGVSAPFMLRVYSEKFEKNIAGDALGNVSFVGNR